MPCFYLLGLPQLTALGAKASLDGSEPHVIFQKVSNRKLPLQYGRAGQLLLNIADWKLVSEAKATVSPKEIEVFHCMRRNTIPRRRTTTSSPPKRRVKIPRWIEAKKEGETICKDWNRGQGSNQEEEGDFSLNPTRFSLHPRHVWQNNWFWSVPMVTHMAKCKEEGNVRSHQNWPSEISKVAWGRWSRRTKVVTRFMMISFTCMKKTFAVDGLRRSADVVGRQVEGDGFQQWEGVLAFKISRRENSSTI